jgi:RimJ/RimL family protein N-acetyltransferase
MLEQARRLGWTRVVAAVDRPNEASRRVLDKLGFSCRGRVPGAFGDTLLFERVEGSQPLRIS